MPQEKRSKCGAELERIPVVTSPLAEASATDQLIARGKAAMGVDDHLTALACFETVSQREPKFADIHNFRGLCKLMLGRPEEAIEAFDRALDLNSGYMEAHINRALVLNELGRDDEAQVSFQMGSEAAEDTITSRYPPGLGARLANMRAEIGDVYAAGGFLSEAAEEYRRACEIRPLFADIRNKLARTLIELGIVEGAVRELRSVLAINPSYTEARVNLGLALFHCGEKEEARAEWEICSRNDPDDPQVRAYLSLLDRENAEDLSVSHVA
ncbi:MAG: tetratricopeptide repeat protein [Gemmatimonadetes bacterium]|nr:tetratricopeptide repeat protein [Gemmatimonadota bacterium]